MLDVVAKTHVEHAVRLVEHHDLERIEPERAALHVVHDAPGRADDNLRAGREGAELPVVTLAAIDRHLHQALLESRQFAKFLRHLHRQFAGRAKHQHLHLLQGHVHLLDRRDGKRRGLAGARGGLAHDVASGQAEGNHGGLDGRGFLETHLIHRLQNFGRETQFAERTFFHAGSVSRRPEKERTKFILVKMRSPARPA